jgi:hypothetical protein
LNCWEGEKFVEECCGLTKRKAQDERAYSGP